MMGYRPLAGMELAAALTAAYAPFHAVSVLHLRNAPSRERLERAFAGMGRRHPLLAARIAGTGMKLRFRQGPDPVATIAELTRGGREHWLQVAQQEVNRRLDASAEPLVRCTALRGVGPDSEGELVLSVCHAIIDATSLTHLLGELLRSCGEAGEGRGTPEPLAILPPAERMLPGQLDGWRRWWKLARFMARQVGDEARFRLLTRGQRKPLIPDGHRNRLVSLRLPAAPTAALIRRCRQRRVPLHGVLQAALLLAVRQHLYAERARALRYIAFADLRPYLRPALPSENLGAYFAMVRHTARLPPGDDLWTLAGEISAQILEGARRGEKILASLVSPWMMSVMLRRRPGRMAATALSYTGPTRLERHYGSIELLGLDAFVPNIDLGPEAAAQVRLFGGELWWDFLFLESEVDEERAGLLSDAVLGRLRVAAASAAAPGEGGSRERAELTDG